jgi:hypothetical protein
MPAANLQLPQQEETTKQESLPKMKSFIDIFPYCIKITGFLVFFSAGFALTLQILDYTMACILKRVRAWGIFVEYAFHRKEFKRWLKSQHSN